MNGQSLLIVGASGQLGRQLQRIYPQATAVDSDSLDISDAKQVEAYRWEGLSCILNAATYTNVDGAETVEGRVAAWRVNAVGVANLAKVALQKSLTLVHISTDYVFDGTKKIYTEEEPFSPLSSYGASKAAGDVAAMMSPAHYLVRTSWVVGEGKNFVRTMLELGKKGISPTVVADQIGRPTFTSELARVIDHLLNRQAPFGVYNMSNEGEPVSWAQLARATFEAAGFDLAVSDTTTQEYFAGKDHIASRPANSLFDLSKVKSTGFSPIDWSQDLEQYVKKELS